MFLWNDVIRRHVLCTNHMLPFLSELFYGTPIHSGASTVNFNSLYVALFEYFLDRIFYSSAQWSRVDTLYCSSVTWCYNFHMYNVTWLHCLIQQHYLNTIFITAILLSSTVIENIDKIYIIERRFTSKRLTSYNIYPFF